MPWCLEATSDVWPQSISVALGCTQHAQVIIKSGHLFAVVLTMVRTNLAAIRGKRWEGVVARAISCEPEHLCVAPVL